MDPSEFIDPNLTGPDLLVLNNLLKDAERANPKNVETALHLRNRGRKCMSGMINLLTLFIH